MNFDFSIEQRTLQQVFREYLYRASTLSRCRKTLESGDGFDRELWAEMAKLGWLGIGIPEQYGGSGLGLLEVALAAEEVGRALSPIPFGSSVCTVTEALVKFGTPEQQARFLPGLANGQEIGVLALAEHTGPFETCELSTELVEGRLAGVKTVVPDGMAATFAIVACRHGELALVSLEQTGIERETLRSVDPSRSVAKFVFKGVSAEAFGSEGTLDSILLRSATLQAFEQIGGADGIFALTLNYMNLRHAFDKPIASYQALKHRMADLYTTIEVARSNAYYAAWALYANANELAEASSSARVAAIQAFELATTEAIQMHGGIGFTWESDCHLFYRRAKWLAASFGSANEWRQRLMHELEVATL